MAYPDSPYNGQGQALDLQVATSGDVYARAAGRAITAAGSDDVAPSLVEDATLLAGHGGRAIAAGPTRTALAAGATPALRITVKAWVTNTNTLYLGTLTVTADTNITTGGFQLSPGESMTFGIEDVADVYIHGTAGEGVSFLYEL